MITFQQARDLALDANAEAWEDQGFLGEYMVAAYGWEDDLAYLVVDGAREALEDGDDGYDPMDKPYTFVDKQTGTVYSEQYLQVADRVDAMTPVGVHPENPDPDA